jgi:hypothetical protein
MPMSKAEMQQHKDEYDRRIEQSRSAIRSRQYALGLGIAKQSWQFMNGMVQHERKHQRESFSFDGIVLVLKFAPLLFDLASLDEATSFLKTERRTMKFSCDDLQSLSIEAQERLWMGYRLWDYLEQHEAIDQSVLKGVLGGSQEKWRGIVNGWIAMGCVSGTTQAGSTQLSLTTRMEQRTYGKCFACGALAGAKKSTFLDRAVCPVCRDETWFVLLGHEMNPG